MFGKRVTWFTAINLAVSGSYFLVISGLKRAMAPECLSEFLYTFQLSGFLIPFVLAGFAPMTYQNWSKHGDSFDIKSHKFYYVIDVSNPFWCSYCNLRVAHSSVDLCISFVQVNTCSYHSFDSFVVASSALCCLWSYLCSCISVFIFREDLVLSALAMVLVLWLVGYAVIIRNFTGFNRDWKSQNF